MRSSSAGSIAEKRNWRYSTSISSVSQSSIKVHAGQVSEGSVIDPNYVDDTVSVIDAIYNPVRMVDCTSVGSV